MIKLIIFDFSNVCFNQEEDPFLEQFKAKHNLSEEFAKDYITLLHKAEVGEGTGIQLWQTLLAKYKIADKPQQTIKEMMDLKEAHWDVLELAKQLRQNYKTAYFTNYNEDYWQHIVQKFNLAPYFDFGVVSFQVRSRKPNVHGFQVILDHFSLEPQEAVFTDDSAKNLVEPAKLGIHTIQFLNKEQFMEELKKVGIKI